MTTLASNGYWFGDTWISIATHALCSPTSRGIPESALYEFDEHVTQLLGFGNTVSTFSIILYDFETSVAQTASAVVWAVLTMSRHSMNSTAETSLLISKYSLHPNNVTPVCVLRLIFWYWPTYFPPARYDVGIRRSACLHHPTGVLCPDLQLRELEDSPLSNPVGSCKWYGFLISITNGMWWQE